MPRFKNIEKSHAAMDPLCEKISNEAVSDFLSVLHCYVEGYSTCFEECVYV